MTMADPPPHDLAPAAALAGRDRERATLREHLAAALAGRGGLVLIGGEAGVGKTALAEWLLAEAITRGALVLVGRCYDLTETPPYGPWSEALARAPRGDDQPAAPDFGGHGVTSQTALFAAVRDHLATLAATRPVVILLDDLHWADPASLDLLRVLARNVTDMPLLLLATYRADEIARRHPLYTLLPLLVREARATRVDLQPLAATDLRALVRARYPLPAPAEARLVAYLDGRAEGNPFFIGELLRALEERRVLARAGDTWALGDLAGAGVPALLGQVIDARVDRLGDTARDLLAMAAVIGQEVPLAVWAAVADADEAALLDTIARAVGARLLAETPDGAGVRFAHALIRETLYAGTLALRRRALHRRVAEALLALPAPDPDRVADHLGRAGDPRAAAWLERAGVRAQRAYAWLTAADRFEAAVALLEAQGTGADERAWLLVRLARLVRHADPRRGVAYLDAALALAVAGDDRALVAAARCHRGLLRCLAGDVHGGLPDLRAGVGALDALPVADAARLGDRQARLGVALDATLRGTLVLWLAYVGRYAEATAQGGRFVAAASVPPGALDDAPLGNAWLGLGIAHAALGRPDAAHAAFDEALACYRAAGHHWLIGGTALMELAYTTLPYRTTDLAARQRHEAVMGEAHGWFAGVGQAAAPAPVLYWLRYVDGDWATAVRADLAVLRESGARLTSAPIARGRIARAQGDTAGARALVSGVLDGPGAEPGGQPLHLALGVQGLAADLALDAGDLPAARAWLDAHDRWLDWSGAVLGRADGHLGWAEYHRAAGDAALARQHAEAAVAHATDPRQPLALLAARRTLGELATVDGHTADAATHLDAALALAEACAAPYERALTLLALAELRATTGAGDGVAAALAEARALLEPLGARPALARAKVLAARLAAPAPSAAPAAPVYPAGLTAREVEVLRLVAAGLPNAQVAERLFLAPRTVNSHLTSIYSRIGVDNRAAATRFALEHGLA
jgi:DNA-binding CsgD family transcriptional regulator/tetratricopeptide (TPR) repeat protein